mmetsp:Transcript_17406/g.29869  ORF Transcript_17406/g.29869 Transcript_17406/m.29869 type:complete len:220 (-) Transcript_17406:47-706(-)
MCPTHIQLPRPLLLGCSHITLVIGGKGAHRADGAAGMAVGRDLKQSRVDGWNFREGVEVKGHQIVGDLVQLYRQLCIICSCPVVILLQAWLGELVRGHTLLDLSTLVLGITQPVGIQDATALCRGAAQTALVKVGEDEVPVAVDHHMSARCVGEWMYRSTVSISIAIKPLHYFCACSCIIPHHASSLSGPDDLGCLVKSHPELAWPFCHGGLTLCCNSI